MQHMPDNDFDNLFKDRFMNAEVEPSANLWANIEGKLAVKPRRKFPVMWVAAASIAVVASVMMFTQSREKIYLQGSNSQVVAVQPVVEQPIVSPAANIAPTTTPAIHRVVGRNLAKREVPAVAVAQLINDQKNIIASVQPSASNEHLPIKRAEVKALDVTNTANVVPVVNAISDNNNEAMMANLGNLVDDDISEQSLETNKKGIRNMGDLINYVVEKVDKREKKLIKFNTDDDDNSSIIGLNIGFVKLNKKNNK